MYPCYFIRQCLRKPYLALPGTNTGGHPRNLFWKDGASACLIILSSKWGYRNLGVNCSSQGWRKESRGYSWSSLSLGRFTSFIPVQTPSVGSPGKQTGSVMGWDVTPPEYSCKIPRVFQFPSFLLPWVHGGIP